MSSKYLHTNIDAYSAIKQGLNYATSGIGSVTGVPQVGALASNIMKIGSPIDPGYSTTPFSQLRNLPWIPINDFRSRKGIQNIGLSFDTRYDGVALSTRKFKPRSALYAALSAQPGGVYSVFNLNGAGKTGYGWGDHGNPLALRNDFTMQSHVATRWSTTTNSWVTVKDPLSLFTAFRGDRVNVIDYQPAGSLKSIYKWKPSLTPSGSVFQETQDFIKFFFTGPKLAPHATNETDDVIVFRATIGSITDTFNPQWTPVQMIGRADPNYHYSSYSRDLSMDFTVYATDRDELKPIYRKLNALAGYTTPDYSSNTIGLKGPWMRITVGDLYNQMPVIISSLSYTLGDTETAWEINIEDDEAMMQVPLMVKVSIGFNVIADWLPQKGGQFYSLSKRFNEFGSLPGSDNWLSDSKQQLINNELTAKKQEQDRENARKKLDELNNQTAAISNFVMARLR
jgi:hypothetical protein